jgi:outer membrane protein, heavy metal efflux system
LVAAAEQLAAQAAVLTARQRVSAALSQWRALTGLSQVAVAEGGRAEYPVTVSEDHPTLRAAALAVGVAQKRLEAVHAGRRDPPEITIGARHEVPVGAGLSSRGIGVSVRVPFATDDRNQPLVASALSELELAQARETRARVELASDLEIAHANLDAARRGLADEENRTRLLRERYELLERSYRAGNTALPDLLRALTASAQADADLQRKRAALELANARVQQALGVLP